MHAEDNSRKWQGPGDLKSKPSLWGQQGWVFLLPEQWLLACSPIRVLLCQRWCGVSSPAAERTVFSGLWLAYGSGRRLRSGWQVGEGLWGSRVDVSLALASFQENTKPPYKGLRWFNNCLNIPYPFWKFEKIKVSKRCSHPSLWNTIKYSQRTLVLLKVMNVQSPPLVEPVMWETMLVLFFFVTSLSLPFLLWHRTIGRLRQWGRLAVAFMASMLLACGAPPEGMTILWEVRRRGAQVPSTSNPWQKGALAIVCME